MAQPQGPESFDNGVDMSAFEAQFVDKHENVVSAQQLRGWIKQGAILSGVFGASGAIFFELGELVPTHPGILWAGKLTVMGSGLLMYGIGVRTLADGGNDFRIYRAGVRDFQNPES